MECTIDKFECFIIHIDFYSIWERLVRVGNDDYVKEYGDLTETFEIAEDEQLIGAELYHGPDSIYRNVFLGVTWLKCKITK